MSKSTSLKTIFQFLCVLLCLVLMPATFAQPEELNGNVTYENGTYENVTPESEVINEGPIVHEINPSSYDNYIQQGKSSNFNVSFKNNGNETLDIKPKIVPVPYTNSNLNESWITISPTNMTANPGEEQNFAVGINVPEDEDGGRYEAYISFTDDIDPYTAQYVNVMYLSIGVPIIPKLELQTDYISDTIEAGKEYEYAIKIKNVADKDVTIDPKITNYNIYIDSFYRSAFNDVIEISAPSIIKAGEIVNMSICVPVPENATGTYSGYIEMNPDGKVNDGSVPQIGLSFKVKRQPAVPYVKTFNTVTTDPITIEVSTDTYGLDMLPRISPKKEEPSFELNLKYNSSPVNMTLVKTTQSGNVDNGYSIPIWAMDDNTTYQSYNKHYVETYTIPGAIGDWELSIFPKNTETFGYSIVLGDSK
ncbi:hypothetical protein RG963_02580 [Methanosarcina sp. Z-7115]|uniref:NPCBM-associated, NEW3 domain of alpha-galactosidase n=1 Tax=Methanosarcina baikalica TaxID=3073890 RepID=A0ABU2CY79_9EURY|nr:hypothetical protein [Methanosarcina sp. Z-7115]MDR7664690.1 hypothetical protein [Methanosarcina sp. Z-7115]